MKSIVSLYLIFMVFSAFSAGEFPDPMKPPRLVNDFVNFLSPVEQAKLEQKLISFSNQTSTQISIVTVKSLNGYDVDEYADRLAEKWGIGTKGKNNGIIILVKPKSAGEKGEISIQIGYGMEGVVTDAVSKRIIEREILPNFKSGEYFKGLDQAVNTLISLTKGEFTADQYVKTRHGENATRFFPFILLIFFFLLFILKSIAARRYNHNITSGDKTGKTATSALPWWVLLMMMNSSGSRGKFGDFSSGSGSFGGGSGGGFGGFGGGSFGGGGASGSW